MLDAVVECLVEKRPTTLSKVFKVVAVVADLIAIALAVIITLFLPGYFILVCVLGGMGWLITWIAFKYGNVEYEYSYFDGEFTVDKIMNKSKRKRVKRFDFAKVDRVAPADANVFGDKPGMERKFIDCSDNDPETEDYIALVMEDQQDTYLIRFTPNEEMLEILKKKYSRKFY